MHYGNDHALSESIFDGFYARTLGASLRAYIAPNLSPRASRLAYATVVPLGLNSNGQQLASLLTTATRARLHTRTAHRSAELLCCCMTWWQRRLRIARALTRHGFTRAALQ